MNLYVLDTDILSLLQFGNPTIEQRVMRCTESEIAVTIITVEEQLSGWYTLRRRTTDDAKLARVYARFANNVRFLAGVQILSFPETAIQRYKELSKMKLGVRANDLRIAAIALDESATVVTRNLRDFQRVPELRVEDWSA